MIKYILHFNNRVNTLELHEQHTCYLPNAEDKISYDYNKI